MTIAAGILCPDGIVLCADTLETIGSFKRHRPKLEELMLSSSTVKAVVVGSTSDSVFLDALIERIAKHIDLADGYLASIRQAIESAVHEYCGEVLHLYASQQDRPIADLLIGYELRTSRVFRILNL